MTQNNIIDLNLYKLKKLMNNTDDIKALSESFLPTSKEEKQESQEFKTKITIDELYEKVEEFKQLARAIKSYEIKGYPEENTENYYTLKSLKDDAEDGIDGLQDILYHLEDGLVTRFNKCNSLKQTEDLLQGEEYERDVMSCSTHCNPIDTKF